MHCARQRGGGCEWRANLFKLWLILVKITPSRRALAADSLILETFRRIARVILQDHGTGCVIVTKCGPGIHSATVLDAFSMIVKSRAAVGHCLRPREDQLPQSG